MLDIEQVLNNLINAEEYDERIVPYIREFFLYNIREFGWNEEIVRKKFSLLKERIEGIEFVDLGNQLSTIDFDFKNILINSSIKGKKLSQDELFQLTSEIFSGLEIMTKDIRENEIQYLDKSSLHSLEKLKYSTRFQDKDSIIQFISNAFNAEPKEVYNIQAVLESRLDIQNREQKDFVEDSMSTLLPSISDSVDRIINSNNIDKSEEYLSIYAISILAIRYRLEDETEDKALLKSQYEAITREFMEKAEEYVITADRLRHHRISNTFSIDLESTNDKIRKALVDIKAKDEEKKKTDNLAEGLGENFFEETASITEESTLEEKYMQQQIAKILPRYEKRFRPIIQEYLTRSSKVYRWTKDEFDKKIRNYLQNIKSIDFTKRIEGQPTSTMGLWSYRDKKFLVKDDTFLVKSDEILDIFFHEQEHATDVTLRNNSKELEREIPYKNINEYATEVGSIHLLGKNMYDDQLCFTHSLKGYNEFKYAGSMISAALGISEFEFARLRDKGGEEFSRVLGEKFSYLDINSEMEEFNNLLERIGNAPTIIYKKEMSETYAEVYNMASRIIKARLEHERENISPEQSEEFELKSKYEKTKIAINMKLAKRKMFLRNKYINPIIEDDSIIKDYSNITSEDKRQYLKLVERIYPEKNVQFDNTVLNNHINQNFKYPVLTKIRTLFERKKESIMLNPASSNFKDERIKFASRIDAREYIGENQAGETKEELEEKAIITEKTGEGKEEI